MVLIIVNIKWSFYKKRYSKKSFILSFALKNILNFDMEGVGGELGFEPILEEPRSDIRQPEYFLWI